MEFENVPLRSLYLTKVDQKTQLFLKDAVFSLLEGDNQLAKFRLVLDDYGSAGIDMISCDENSGIRVRAPQISETSGEEDEGSGGDSDGDGGDDDFDGGDEDADDSDGDDDAGFDDDDEADGEITIVDPYDEDDTEGDSEEEGSEGEPVEYNFAVIRGLKEGKTYTLKEEEAPEGYAAAISHSFTFEDGQKLVLENAAPQIGTMAVDRQTKSHMSNAEGTVTIVDTVSYSNLMPGQSYLMRGFLACKPEGEKAEKELEQDDEVIEVLKDADGKEVTAQKEFKPKSESGTVEMEFTFDASLLDGKQVVAMEQLTEPERKDADGNVSVIASHEDIDDEAQSIYFPAVGTTAKAEDTGKRITEADGEITIIDTVEYSNVIAGKVYVLQGQLMDKETGKPLLSRGEAITSSVTFRADQEGPALAAEGEELSEAQGDSVELVSGSVEMTFRFDGSALLGKQAVAFEKLMTEGRLVGEHSDLKDEAQTVYLPSIETRASTNGTDRVLDKVMYKNLLPGENYLMEGVLMDKATGEELVQSGSVVTAQKEFVPEKKDGSMMMEFPVAVKDLEGKTLVAFETCSILIKPEEGTAETAKIELVSHKDINNKAQTVSFDVPQTGQQGPWRILFPAGLFTAAGISALLRRLRRI